MGQQSASQQANPYAAPKASVEDVGGVEQDLAGRRQRLGAAFVDGILFFLCGLLMGVGTIGLVLGVLAMIGLVVANLWLLNRNSQTVGKYSFDIKIVRTDGSDPTLVRIIFLRGLPVWIVSAIPFLNLLTLVDILFIYRSDRRCVHDLIADTMVVKAV